MAGSIGRGDSVAIWVGMKVTVTLRGLVNTQLLNGPDVKGKEDTKGKGVMNHSLTNQFGIGLSQ